MVYVGKKAKIRMLRSQIAEANKKIDAAREAIVDNNFDLNYIREYNNSLSELNCLKLRLDHELRHMKPQQYMDEVKLPGNISS